jgi:hypothetical protein
MEGDPHQAGRRAAGVAQQVAVHRPGHDVLRRDAEGGQGGLGELGALLGVAALEASLRGGGVRIPESGDVDGRGGRERPLDGLGEFGEPWVLTRNQIRGTDLDEGR